MELNFSKKENIVTVYLQGRVDVYMAQEIEKEINRLLSAELSSHLIFNLNDVEYMSSSGIALLVTIMNRQRQKGKKFVICNLSGPVKKILEVVEMTLLFEIHKTESEAVEYLSLQQ
jgi:anti-anti-sigma factor